MRTGSKVSTVTCLTFLSIVTTVTTVSADWAAPLAIHGGARVADCLSTRGALARGGVEVGPVASHTGPTLGCVAGGAAFLGADLLAQRTKKRWVVWGVRGASIAVGAYAVHHNRKVGR